ncbi:HC-toxin synthetase-like protein [Venustampulla echinocandica]|uniref:HC-toxin synthetase-like protein n=1 Tax=Venustampulla echinocandica TaxID=2656787 RepID=A0A370TD86_9HELO|nr:HC-toxin synthetase-like protein [Venustampulla echinocandica]RDL32391.1 HC-toxin synthetase-like protein [Venustampulla echinocandica]
MTNALTKMLASTESEAENTPKQTTLFDKSSHQARIPLTDNDLEASQCAMYITLESRMQTSPAEHQGDITTRASAAWAVLLSTWAASTRVIFALSHPDADERSVGVDPIVVETSVDTDLTIADLIRSLRLRQPEVLPNGTVKHLLIQCLAERNGDYAAIKSLTRADSSQLTGESCTLRLRLQFTGSEILTRATFDATVVEEEQMRRVVHQLEHVLRQLTAAAGDISTIRVRDIEVFSPQDAHEMASWTDLPTSTLDTCAHHLIEQQAKRQPSALAVSAWDAQFTYEEVDGLSNRLASHLRGLGVGPDVLVPFCFEKSAWAVVSMLAILKAGGACVGLDSSHPMSRLSKIIEDSDSHVILTSGRCKGLFSGLDLTIIPVDEAFVRSLPCVPFSPCTTVNSSHAAYVTFTSGTTGIPKGIIIEHRAICWSGATQGRTLRLGPASRVLQFAAYSFDISNGDILNTLMNGGCICVPSEDERSNDLAGFISRMGVNWACLTPSAASILHPLAVPTLETLVLCGEPIKQEIVRLWADAVYLVDAYGPAETTILCTSNPGVKPSMSSANLGRNMGANTWIVNPSDHDQLRPLGCAGEIVIEGPLLARGYLNDTDKTSLSFIENPRWAIDSSSDDPRRLYKSGDLGFFNTDGTITFVGRKDSQVKIRGQRVELHEIEHHLRASLHPETGPVVAGVVSIASREVMAAFICLEDQIEEEVNDFKHISELTKAVLATTVEGVAAKLVDYLPAHMIPTVFFPLKTLPRNRSGKIDRVKLRELTSRLTYEDIATSHTLRPDTREPSTDLEKQLQAHWASALKIEQRDISADDNFIRLGGDSLTAMKLVAACRASGIPLQVANVLSAATLADLAATVDLEIVNDQTQQGEGEISPFSLLDKTISVQTLIDATLALCTDIGDANMIQDAYPCTALQEGLMALSYKQHGSYVGQEVIKLPENIDMSRFQGAWKQTIEACDILRTRLVYGEGEILFQVVLTTPGPWLQKTITSSDMLQEILDSERSVVMNPGQSLSRYAVVSDASTGTRYFVWTIHHVLYDAWSMPIIKNMVEKAYAGGDIERPPNFNQFIKEVKQLEGEASEEFWRLYLDECEVPMFPTISTPIYLPDARSTLDHSFQIPRRREAAYYTLPTVLRAAMAGLVGCYTDSNDVVFGVTLSGRNVSIPDIASLVGPTIVTVPVRIRWSGTTTMGDVLVGVQQQSVDMIPFEQLGLQNIQRLGEGANHACQFQSLLNIRTLPDDSVTDSHALFPPGNIMGGEMGSYGTYTFILYCVVTPTNEVLVRAAYDEKVLDRTQVTRYVRQYEHLVRQFCTLDHSARMDNSVMSSITEADWAEVRRWNSSSLVSVDSSFQALFTEQVELRPEAMAVRGWDGKLSYTQLEDLSTRLACHLIEKADVKPGTFVPLCLEKSVWSIVTIIATIKTGACIVPMEPLHPVHRRHVIVSAVEAKVILCSRQYASDFRDVCDQVLVIDEAFCKSLPSPRLEHSLLSLSSASSALYTLFTSGSTGTPKGVVMEHGAFLSSAIAYAKGFLLSHQSRVLLYSSYSFDVSILEMLTPLILGACVCVVSDHDRLHNLGAAMETLGANAAFLTPTVARTIDPQSVPTLEVLALGGESVDRCDIAQWESSVPHFFEWYGPTECGVISSGFASHNLTTELHNLGRAFNAKYWVTAVHDPNKLVPIGAVGELLIEGPIIARGYLGDLVKTENAFVKGLVWATDRQGRFYRTGDVVRYDATGNVIFLGRRDTQVKLRGQRIDLGEIQAGILRSAPDVQSAVVDIVSIQDPMLVAFVCLKNEDAEHGDAQNHQHEYLIPSSPKREAFLSSLNNIEAQLLSLLPRYMVPFLFVPLWRLPMTASKKLDRKGLCSLVAALSSKELAEYRGPAVVGRNPSTWAEGQLQHLWAGVLSMQTNEISAESIFLAIGGDSIRAIRLVAACRARGLQLSIPQIFQSPKLEDMALLLTGNTGNSTETVEAAATSRLDLDPEPFSMFNDDRSPTAPTTPAQNPALEEVLSQCHLHNEAFIEDIYPTAPLQEGLMALSIKETDSYKSQSVIDLTSAGVDADRFSASWDHLVELTPILRTRICNTESRGSLQVVCKEPIEWHTSEDLNGYLEQDRSSPMSFGERLARYAIVRSSAARCHFVWTMHHALYDAWTIRLILDHVHSIYAGRKIEKPTGFSRYIEYVTESNQAAGSALSEQFWRSQLEGATLSEFPPLSRLTYHPRPDTITHHSFDLPPGTLLGGEYTRSTLALAAWAVVVGRYTGSADVIFGTILSGRYAPIPGIEHVLGPTINTVAIRRKIDPNQTVGQYLGDFQKQAISMIPHEIFGLQRIQHLSDSFYEACQFRSLLVIQPEGQDNSDDAKENEGWLDKFTSPPGELDFAGYPLALDCTMTKTRIKVTATYDSNMINAAQMDRVLHQFIHALTQLCLPGSFTTTLGSLEILSTNDIQQISDWNRPPLPPVNNYLDDMFSNSALLRPAAPAVHAWDGNFTYSELDDLSTSLALRLIQLSIGPETPLPLCFHKTRWYLVAMIATLKAGGTFVPMDPGQPLSRLKSILLQTQAGTVLCSPQNANLFRDVPCDNVIVVGDDYLSHSRASVDGATEALRSRHKRLDDAAYIIFTSGSTGEPKGCVVTHQAYCSHLTAHARHFAGSTVRSLQFSSYSFDASLLEIFTTLVVGGCVCIPSDASRLENIAGFISDMKVNWAFLTPSVARLIDPAAVPTLKTLWIGGEGVSQDDIRPWLGRVHIVQVYGPTECAVISSLVDVGETTHSNDIGNPLMSNYWIVDAQDHHVLLPVGAVGELLIDGPVLARGYLGDAARTAASFIEETPRWLRLLKDGYQRPRRMYKTGDLVRYDADGAVIYMGRKQSDMQVKLRGLRIQLDEVEHHLRKALRDYEQDLVAELVHVEGKAMLVAFLADAKSSEAHGGSSDKDLCDVDAATRSRLASIISTVEGGLIAVMHSTMIPSAYIPVRCIPMSTTAKTNRALLRRLVSRLSLSQLNALKVKVIEKHVEPSTPMERRLQAIWATVLGVERRTISAGDTFFGIGADSITAIRLTGACRAQNIVLSPRDIFRNPVLRDMASVATLVNQDEVQAVDGDEDDEVAHFSLLGQMSMYQRAAMECGVAQDDIEDIYPCTALQEGMMATSVRIPGAYAAQGVAELRSDVDVDRLRGAWEKTVELNPVLRTRLIHASSQSDGQFVQVVVKESICWQYAESLSDYTAQDSHKTMGLGRPLTRYAIVDDKASGRRFFVWTLHHALYDGWSLSLILKAVNDAYHRKHDDGAYRKNTKEFRSYIKYLEKNTSLEAAEAYWQSSLQDATPAGFPPMTLASARQRPQPDSALRHTIEIAPASTQRASAAFTLPTIVRAAWAILIARYTDSRDVFFGTVVTGRTAPLPGIENIAGPTASTVPVRTVVNPDTSVFEYLRQVQDQAAEMMPFETLGIQRIQRLSEGARAACRFQNLLVIQPQPAVTSDLVCPVQVAAAGDVLDNVRDTYAMGVECSLGEQSVEVDAAYDSKIISHKQMQRVMSQFSHLVQQLLQANETRLVGELDMLGPNGREEIESWNAGSLLLESAELCLDGMFEASVHRNGGKVAIEAWDGNLTYEALDQAANCLAQHLVNVGVRPEVKVPLCFQKSKWMVVAMLAVAKAGGAMVPLDPAHPRDRLEFIMNAVNANAVLCSADQAGWISGCKKKTAIVVDDSYRPSSDHQVISGRTALSNALYVIFTSGSSGEPKGCVMEHRAFCSMVPHLARGALFGPSVRILQLASYSFGAAIAEMLATLIYGGSICIVPSEARARLPQVLKEMNINYMFMTPSFSRLIPPQAISTVKTLIMGAESMTSSDLEKWAPHVRLVQGYGQTECATIMSCHPNMTAKSHPRNVGSPMASRFWIVDASNPDILAPIGATGEVLIEGPILARGYLNDPEKTAAAFVKPPSWRSNFPTLGNCERLYRTGDLACFDDDGTLLFMGRKDNQVKLRGQRIELGEIEHHLQRAMPGAKGVVVELLEKSLSGTETHSTLVAFVALGTEVASNDLSKIDPAAIEALHALISSSASQLSRFLPSYMIPSVYLPLGAIPMTASAKVNRRALRAMLSDMSMDDLALHSLSKVAKREPSTPMEKLLQKLWSSVLPVDVNSIGADDHFLQVGGDSISAIKLVSLCQSEGLKLSVADIFENPTLSKMAAALRTASTTEQQSHQYRRFSTVHNSTEDGVVSDMIRHCIVDSNDDVEDVLETTYMQTILVARGLREPRSKANYISLNFTSTLDTARLEAACHALVERHQILRTVFFARRQQLLQVVLRSFPGAFSHYQCSNGESLETFADRMIEEDTVNDRAALGKSFIRFMFFDGGAAGFRLTLRINHAQFDGISFPLLLEDLAALYGGTASDVSSWPGFSSFVYTAHEMHDAGAVEFYRGLLDGASMTEIALHKKPPYYNYPASQLLMRRVPRVEFLERGITFAIVLKAAWAKVLAAVTGQADVVFGYLVSGRSLPMAQIEDVVGPCINVTPVRVDTRQANTKLELLESVRDQNLQGMPYETYPYDDIVSQCTQWPSWTRFSTLLECQVAAVEPGTIPFGEGLECFLSATNPRSDLADLVVDAMPSTSGGNENIMCIQFLHSAQRVSSSLVADMADLLCSYLDQISHQNELDSPLSSVTSAFEPIAMDPTRLTNGSASQHASKDATSDVVDASKTAVIISDVEKVWREVFGEVAMGPVTPFYSIWSSPIAAAQLADQYKRLGYQMEMEDIIEHATMEQQSDILNRGDAPS